MLQEPMLYSQTQGPLLLSMTKAMVFSNMSPSYTVVKRLHLHLIGIQLEQKAVT